MPITPSSISVVPPAGSTVLVNITFGGHAAVMYTTRNGSTAVTFPTTISTSTSFFADVPGDYTVSVKLDGIEVAGDGNNTVVVALAQGIDHTVVPRVDQAELAPLFAAAGMNAIPYQSGRYYFAPNFGGASTSVTLGNGTLRLTPWWVPNACALSRIGSEVTLAGESGSKLRLGIYYDDGTGRPGALLLDAGTIDGTSATAQEITVSQAIGPGFYWIGGAVQLASTTQPTVRIHTASGIVPNVDAGTSTPAAAASGIGRSMTGVTGALPAAFVDGGAAGSIPRVFVKVA